MADFYDAQLKLAADTGPAITDEVLAAELVDLVNADVSPAAPHGSARLSTT